MTEILEGPFGTATEVDLSTPERLDPEATLAGWFLHCARGEGHAP